MNYQYRVVLVEDDEKEIQRIAYLLKPCIEKQQISFKAFTSIRAFEAYCKLCQEGAPEETIDILLMDIKFEESEQTGIECVSRIAEYFPRMQTIYLTGYIEYCTQVYETDHVYFLLKPITGEMLYKALDKAVSSPKKTFSRPLMLKAQGVVHQVFPEEITFIESKRRKAVVHTLYTTIEVYASLSSILESLPDSFVQCHKSFLVNLNQVESLDSKIFVLKTGDQVPVSQTRLKETRDAFFDKVASVMR